MNLIVGSKEEAKDYAKGLLAGAIALFCFFSIWMVILLVLKCLGYQRVGFLSGQNVQRPKPPLPPQPPPPPLENKETDKQKDMPQHSLAQHLEQTSGDCNPQADDSSSASKAFTDTFSAADTQVMANLSIAHTGSRSGDNQTKNTTDEQLCVASSALPAPAAAAAPASPEEYEKRLREWKKEVRLRERRLRNIRIMAFLAGCGIIICVVIMLLQGIRSLENSLDESRNGLREGQRLAQDAIELIDDYMAAQNETLDAAESFVEDANGICPLLREELCTNLRNSTSSSSSSVTVNQTCNFTGIPEEFVQVIEPVLVAVKNTVYVELMDMQEDLQEIYDILSDADETAGTFQWAFAVAGGFAGLLGVFDLFMMSGIILAWRSKSSGGEGCVGCTRRCLRGFLLIPVFVLCVVFCWVFSMVFVIGSTATADFCYVTPDPRVTALLEELEDEFSGSVVYDFALFYTSACSPEKVPLDMNNKIGQILAVFADLASFLTSLSTSSAEFQGVCGTEPSAIDATARILGLQLCVLANALFDVQDFFSCRNWYPLYSVVMHESVCAEGFEGFHYVAISQFSIVVFAMIMLTTRVAFYDIMDEENAEKERLSWVEKWKRCYTCHCCSPDDQQNVASDVGDNVFLQEEDQQNDTNGDGDDVVLQEKDQQNDVNDVGDDVVAKEEDITRSA